MIAKLIGKILIVVLVLAGGYIGFRMVVKHESFMEALGRTQEQVKEQVEAQAAKHLPPLKQADFYYGKGDYEKAVEFYEKALERADASDANENEKLTAEQRRHVRRRIADSHYEIAKEAGWPADKVKLAADAYTSLLGDFPDISGEDRVIIGKRIAELKLKAFTP